MHGHLDRTISPTMDELLNIGVAATIHRGRWTAPGDITVVQHGDIVGNLADGAQIMGDCDRSGT
jgi:hypothetical protein